MLKSRTPLYAIHPNMSIYLHSICFLITSMSSLFNLSSILEPYKNINTKLFKVILLFLFSLPISKVNKTFTLFFLLPTGIKAVNQLLPGICLEWCLKFTLPKKKYNQSILNLRWQQFKLIHHFSLHFSTSPTYHVWKHVRDIKLRRIVYRSQSCKYNKLHD